MSVLQDIAPEGAFDSTATYGMAEQLRKTLRFATSFSASSEAVSCYDRALGELTKGFLDTA